MTAAAGGARAGSARRTLPTALAVGALVAVGCAGPSRQVRRTEIGEQVDLSGDWNDTDARETATALVKDCFSAPWLDRATAGGKLPAVRVRGVVNKTDEHIDAQLFIKSIERAMINSGRVRVLAQEGIEMESMASEQIRAASGAQADNSPVRLGNETGADFVVAVRVATVLDQIDGVRVKFYQVDFELVSPTSGEKAWIGEHQIKKVVTQRGASW